MHGLARDSNYCLRAQIWGEFNEMYYKTAPNRGGWKGEKFNNNMCLTTGIC